MKKLSFLFLAMAVLSVISCKKTNEQRPVSNLLSVYLTDNPADLDEVNIDIHSVEVKFDENNSGNEQQIALLDNNNSNDSLGAPGGTLWHGGIPVGDGNEFGKWVALNFQPGIYDILKLRNGINMLLGTVEAPGTVRKIRIALGKNSYVVKNGVQLPLKPEDDSTNAAHHIYITILKESLVKNSDGSLAVYLDFDLGRSVTELDGKYSLFPYLRTMPADRSLEIEGSALPSEARIIVSIYTATDTINAIPDKDGYFKVTGLVMDTYHVKYQPGNPLYKDTTIANMVVRHNKLTLPRMTLEKK